MRWAQHELSSPRLGQQLEFSRLEMAFPYFVHDRSEVALALFFADVSRAGDSQGEAAWSCALDTALAGIGQVGEEPEVSNLKAVELLAFLKGEPAGAAFEEPATIEETPDTDVPEAPTVDVVA